MASEDQSFIRPVGVPKGTKDSSTQFTGVYFKVQYPGKTTGFHVIFNTPFISSLGTTSSPQWGVEPAAGRADPLYRLESYTRDLRLSFNLVAHNAAEHDDNYFQLNRLAAATLPFYDGGNNGFNGCHVHFSIGGASSTDQRLLKGVGLLNSVDYNWDERTPWLTADSPSGYTAKILPTGTTAPMITTVQIAITILSLAKDNKRPHLREDANPSEIFYLQKYSK